MLPDVAIRSKLAGFFAIVALAGCAAHQRTPTVQADLTAPKPAALTFFRAIAAGDARTARAASVGTDRDKQWIDGVIAMADALRTYSEAIRRRFGVEAAQEDTDIRQALLAMTQDPITQLDGGIVQEDASTARIDPALNQVRLASRAPVYLRKLKNSWKVDLKATVQADPSRDTQNAARYAEVARVLKQVAAEVRIGRYRSLAEVQQAIEQKSQLN